MAAPEWYNENAGRNFPFAEGPQEVDRLPFLVEETFMSGFIPGTPIAFNEEFTLYIHDQPDE